MGMPLHGVLNTDRSDVSRTSSAEISSMLETWNVRIHTTLWKDGHYVIRVEDRDLGTQVAELRGQYPEAVTKETEQAAKNQKAKTKALYSKTE